MDGATIKFSQPFHKEPDFDKFNTCRNRSDKEEQYTVRTCCQYRQETGWVCHKLQIQGLTPNHCRDCQAYEKKEEPKPIIENEQN